MKRACTFVGAGLALLVLSVASGAPIMSTDVLAPFTQPFDQSFRPWSAYLPLDDPTYSIRANASAGTPTQVHLSIAGDNSLYVMWATGQAKVGTGSLTPNAVTPGVVNYGTSMNSLTQTATATGETYNQIYLANQTVDGITNGQNYTSPVLHTAILANLTGNTTYYYTVGDGTAGGTSEMYTFRSLPSPGTPSFPQRIGFIADWGYSTNSSTTLEHIMNSVLLNQQNPTAVFYIADFCYADGWSSNGTQTGNMGSSAIGYEGVMSETYQPVWDAWMRFLEPLVSEVPMIGATGNHEIEQQYDANGTIFASVQARWKVPKASGSYFYHSENFGPVHSIFLSPYVDYTPGSAQWTWLQQDLQGVNRTAQPWVIVSFHNPWYTTDTSFKQMEQMRASLEPITYQYGVDLFYYGHVHAYERTAPMYNWLVDPCGAVHITIGDGGNSEGVSGVASDQIIPYVISYQDKNGGCPNVTASTRYAAMYEVPGNSSDHFSYYKTALTFQGDGNSTGPPGMYPPGYCWKEQPLWSQYREPSFGHGTLDILNATHALWQWHRNQDSEAVATDQTYIVRNTTLCPQKLGSAGFSSGAINVQGLNNMTSSSVQNAG